MEATTKTIRLYELAQELDVTTRRLIAHYAETHPDAGVNHHLFTLSEPLCDAARAALSSSAASGDVASKAQADGEAPASHTSKADTSDKQSKKSDKKKSDKQSKKSGNKKSDKQSKKSGNKKSDKKTSDKKDKKKGKKSEGKKRNKKAKNKKK